MIHKEYWESNPSWPDYILSKWQGLGRVEQVKDDSIESFRARAIQSFIENKVNFVAVKTWINVMIPKQGSEYDDGYPHVHYPLSGLTLVHYVDPGDVPACLDIFEDGKVVETVIPEKGLTVYMPNDLWHGVRKNQGTKKRLALIATALR